MSARSNCERNEKRNCIFDCVLLLHKGYPWSGSGRSIEVYENTPELLEAELSSVAICPRSIFVQLRILSNHLTLYIILLYAP